MSKVVKLKPSVKKKWLKALRSGEYKQGFGKLRNTDDGFCCLGVLCNIHAKEHPEIAAKQKTPTMYMDASYLPANAVMDWAFQEKTRDNFAKFRTGVHFNHGGRNDLVGLNDDLRYSFKQIANVIDKYL